MAVRVIYLLRHGQEDRENRPDELGGSLTAVGIAQAQATAEYLRYTAFDAIFVSPLRRAQETADLILSHHPTALVEKTADLVECVPSIPAMLLDVVKELSPEQIAAEQQRIAAAFSRFFVPAPGEGDVQNLIISHGNLIRYFVCRVLAAPLDMWVNLEIANCGISRVEVRPNGRMVLVTHNEHYHIPPRYHTYS